MDSTASLYGPDLSSEAYLAAFSKASRMNSLIWGAETLAESRATSSSSSVPESDDLYPGSDTGTEGIAQTPEPDMAQLQISTSRPSSPRSLYRLSALV